MGRDWCGVGDLFLLWAARLKQSQIKDARGSGDASYWFKAQPANLRPSSRQDLAERCGGL